MNPREDVALDRLDAGPPDHPSDGVGGVDDGDRRGDGPDSDAPHADAAWLTAADGAGAAGDVARWADPDGMDAAAPADVPTPAEERDPPERSPDAILARIHLRGGLIALARAELEAMAGTGSLDTPALADLAETRWRSGDLAGAADAAQAHIDAGGTEPMALLVLAEALDADGHLIDARAMAARVLEQVGGHVDRLFAGERRSSAWSTAGAVPTPLPPGTVAWGALCGGQEIAEPELADWSGGVEPELPPVTPEEAEAAAAGVSMEPEAAPVSEPIVSRTGFLPGLSAHATVADFVDAGLAAGRELEAVESAIEEVRLEGVAERLALLLRMDRALAPVILAHADRALAASTVDDAIVAALHLVRGDALRSLGHEAEATAAYQLSMRALAARATIEETS